MAWYAGGVEPHWQSSWLVWYVFYMADEGRESCCGYLAVLLPLYEQERKKSPFI